MEKGWGVLKDIGTRRGGPRRMHEVVAGAGAHEGHVGCVWDGDGTLRGGRACQRGRGTSRGMGHVLGGHGATHHMSPSVGWFAWTQGWQRRHVVGVRMRAHKHGGHGQHNITAATKQGEDAHTQRAAKAKCIDEKGVRLRGGGDGGDSKVGGAAVFSAWCRPHVSPRPCKIHEWT